ncbi:hypothetical protein BVC80_41g5 [Macleaya cordata]|uniref:Uncharacterized protein n=1 Tax=Macleaya cordata TaxID=56857 RepID=A0A200QMS2_MACCD|nr:hypothetical protein BVC80_41g5 [Macleaya cordata]
MADKASRALVLYGDGLVGQISSSHIHLHDLASRGTCGFLSLTDQPSHADSEDERVVRELAQLLDAYDAYVTRNGENSAALECAEKSTISTISERFMGLRAAILTTNSSVKSFGRYLGFTVLEFDELTKNNHSANEPPACELLKLLGFEEGKTLDTGEFDLVFVHIGRGEANILKNETIGNEVEWVNALVGGILQIAQPGSEIGSRLHFSVVMSYGGLVEDEDTSLLQLISQKETNSDLSLLVPRQSYTMKGANLVNNTRHHCPMLITQWQEAVTRKDRAERFSFHEFKEHGGNLAIPADRFLHEVAFKLWKAPKYGA